MKYLLVSFAVVLVLYFIASVVFIIIKKTKLDTENVLTKDITDICKGFAIVIIILAHISNLFNVRYMTPCGAWGVSIFLFLSGFGLELSYKKNGLKGFVKKRLVTAYLPFVLIEIICIIFSINFTYVDKGWLGIVKSLLLIEPIHPYGWYMQCLFLHYIAFYISKVFFADKKWFKWLVLLIVSFLILLFLRSLFKQQIFAFTLGVFIACNKEKLLKYLGNILIAIMFLLVGSLFIACRQIEFIRLLPNVLYNLIIAIESSCLMLGTICLFSFLVDKLPNVIFIATQKLGVIAFDLYLMHAFAIQFVLNNNVSLLNIIVFFVLTICLSCLFYIVRKLIFNLKINQNKVKD